MVVVGLAGPAGHPNWPIYLLLHSSFVFRFPLHSSYILSFPLHSSYVRSFFLHYSYVHIFFLHYSFFLSFSSTHSFLNLPSPTLSCSCSFPIPKSPHSFMLFPHTCLPHYTHTTPHPSNPSVPPHNTRPHPIHLSTPHLSIYPQYPPSC